jgi:hypothetical protein
MKRAMGHALRWLFYAGVNVSWQLSVAMWSVCFFFNPVNSRALRNYTAHPDEESVWDPGGYCFGLCAGNLLHVLHVDSG